MNTKTLKKNSFTIIKDKNLFDMANLRLDADHRGSTVIIPHVCNNINAFGAGFAGHVATLYPEVKANFHLLGNKNRLGHTQFVTVKVNKKYNHQMIFANMIAQNNVIGPSNPRPLNYGALVHTMFEVRNYIKELQKTSESNKVEIHAPKFGSGLAGGNWNFISELIEDIWYNIPVFVYLYK